MLTTAGGRSSLRRTISAPTTEVVPMPQKAWSDKRERQYEHIKDSYEDRGVGHDEAEERAARTVNKERAEHGETKSSRKR
jgi:hypothetical protein